MTTQGVLSNNKLLFTAYRSNRPQNIVFQVELWIHGEALINSRFIIGLETVKRIIEFGEDNTKDFNVLEDSCIVSGKHGTLTFKGKCRTIAIENNNLNALIESMRSL